MTQKLFCKACGYSGEFNMVDDKPIDCPKCWSHHVISHMKPMNVDWLKQNTNLEIKK